MFDSVNTLPRLALIDGDFIPFYCTVGNKVLDASGNVVKEDGKIKYTEKSLEECILNAKMLLEYTFTNTRADYYIGVLGKGTSFRKKLYPSYKANREGKELPKHFKEVKNWLFTYKKFIYIDDLEADDVVNILRFKPEIYNHYQPFIVSPDRDILSLTGTHYDPKHGIWHTTSEEEAHYKKYIDLLKGQPGDNILGIRGIGDKKSKEILSTVEPRNYQITVFREYIKYYGEDLGVEEFYKNYKLLTLLQDYNLEIPTPIAVG